MFAGQKSQDGGLKIAVWINPKTRARCNPCPQPLVMGRHRPQDERIS
jgi:hypothetical protein